MFTRLWEPHHTLELLVHNLSSSRIIIIIIIMSILISIIAPKSTYQLDAPSI